MEAVNPRPIGSSMGSMRYGIPHRESAFTLGSSVSIEPPRSGTTTTLTPVPARCCAASMFEPLRLRTRSAPAATATRISPGSNVSTLTRIWAATNSRTTSPRAGNGSPGVQPISMMSAPDALK